MIKNIERQMRRYRGIPFTHGGYFAEDSYMYDAYGCWYLEHGKGLDCVGFLYRFFTDLGVDMPDGCAEATKENYSEVYLRDALRADELLLEYFDTLPGVEINPQEVLAGDAIIVKYERYHNHLMPAVYGGNGIAITSFLRSQVKTFALSEKMPVIKARRIV